MAEAKLTIGTRSFRVACEDGQEHLLQSAAALLDQNAKQVGEGAITESQLLLMAGLMAADQAKDAEREKENLRAYHRDLETRIGKVEDQAKRAEEEARAEAQGELHAAKADIAQTQKELRESEEKLAKALAEVEATRGLLDDAKRAKPEMAENEAAQGADLKALEAEINRLKAENQSLKARVDNDFAGDAGSQGALGAENARLMEENASLDAQLQIFLQGVQSADISDMPQAENAQQSKQIAKLESEKTELAQALEAREKIIAKLENEVAQLRPSNDVTQEKETAQKATAQKAPGDDLMSDLLAGLERMAGE